MTAGTGATAVAVKVTGLPDNPLPVASKVCGPAVGPSFQLPTVAMPDAFVTTVPPVTLPLPGPGVNVTVNPATKFPFASVTFTLGAVAMLPPAVPV